MSSLETLLNFRQSCQQNLGSNQIPEVNSFFKENPTLLYVPTGVSANTTSDVLRLIKEWCNVKDLIKDELIVSRTTSFSHIVEETVVTIIHDEVVPWLLPNVKPTNRRLVVPLVTVYNFDSNFKIISQHVYWDQASVLKQIGLLPNSLFCKANNSETVLPICGIKIADPLLLGAKSSNSSISVQNIIKENQQSEQNTEKMTQAPVKLSKKSSVADVFSGEKPQEETYHSSTRVFHPPGGISNIFNSETPTPSQSHVSKKKTNLSSLGDVPAAAEAAELTAGNKRFSTAGIRSQIAFGVDEDVPFTTHRKMSSVPSTQSHFSLDGSVEEGNLVHSQKKHNPDANRSHFSLAGDVDGKEELHFSKKMSDKNAYDTHFSIGNDDNVQNGANEFIPSKKLGLGSQFESHFALNGGKGDNTNENVRKSCIRDHNAASIQINQRPSSRVLGPPGGKSQIQF
ncbi:hypothetical protein HK099_004189 [Clydaea vesicula]|uniref:Uncharacterized protein n=1 Tax=Clydaea vesicula TaxID=447962 RepID=A0AAD5U734_9FUNG|nr:hypothetical protein HK099_004189 [Clydaea vesicula]